MFWFRASEWMFVLDDMLLEFRAKFFASLAQIGITHATIFSLSHLCTVLGQFTGIKYRDRIGNDGMAFFLPVGPLDSELNALSVSEFLHESLVLYWIGDSVK